MNTTEQLSTRILQKILYVDDDEDMQLIVEVALSGFADYSLETCSSWDAAKEKIGTFMPDLILLDLMMPEIDGLAALKEIQSIDVIQKIPVIFLTAHLQPSQFGNLEQLGILGVVTKPFKPNLLAGQISALWDNREEAQHGAA